MVANIVILGAGGVAREVHDILDAINEAERKISNQVKYNFIGFIAERNENSYLVEQRGPLLGGDELLTELPKGTNYIIGIGEGAIRSRLSKIASEAQLTAATLVHPQALIGNFGNTVGEGSVIAAFSSVTTNITIGKHVFIDRNVMIGHDSKIQDFASLYPSCTVAGNVSIEPNSTIGTGSKVLQGLTVGESAYVGAGAVVISSVPSNAVVVGVPAKELIKGKP